MPSRSPALLVSVKPVYADLLLSGAKTVELRRVRPQVKPGCPVLLYASSPQMAMVGTARVSAITCDSPDAIWNQFSDQVGIDYTTFAGYFAGTGNAVAITLADVEPLPALVPLAELRRRISGFRPPQSFRYLTQPQAAVAI